MCIIHFNSVILFLDFVRIGLVVKWLLVANELVPSFSAVTNQYEVAFGLVCGRNESSRKDTSSTGMIGADFDVSEASKLANHHVSYLCTAFNQHAAEVSRGMMICARVNIIVIMSKSESPFHTTIGLLSCSITVSCISSCMLSLSRSWDFCPILCHC